MEESITWFRKGVILFENGNYSDAITSFDKAIKINPSLNEAWNNRGVCLIRTGHYKEAILSFDKALALNPRHENAKKARVIAIDLLEDQKKTDNVPGPARELTGSQSRPTVPQKQGPTPANWIIRNPWYSVIFSLVMPGWGQWYNGRRWDGLKFFGLVILVSLIGIPFSENRAVTIILFLILLGIWLFGMNNAYRTAGKINRGDLEFIRKSRLFWGPALVLILPVVTVILGILGAVFFSIAANTSHAKVVAATAQQPDSETIVVTYLGGQDAVSLTRITAMVTDSNGRKQDKTIGTPGEKKMVDPDRSLSFSGDFTGKDHVIVVGLFNDGTESVILDTTV